MYTATTTCHRQVREHNLSAELNLNLLTDLWRMAFRSRPMTIVTAYFSPCFAGNGVDGLYDAV